MRFTWSGERERLNDAPQPRLAPKLLVLLMGLASAHEVLAASQEEMVTDIGQFRVAPLGDGLTVHLNTNTRVRIQSGPRCSVDLLAGEILLEVQPHATCTLRVGAGIFTVTKGLARLNAKRKASTASIAVMEGTALVRHERDGDLRLELVDGDEAVIRMARVPSVSRHRIDSLDLMRRTAWTQGRLWFEGEPLREVVSRLNRFNQRRLIISDASIASISIGGVFRPDDLDAFLAALAALGVRSVDASERGRRDVIRLYGSTSVTRDNQRSR